VDPVGEADVEVAEVKVESAIFRLQMLTLAQMVAMARRVVRVSMASSSRKETQVMQQITAESGGSPASLEVSPRAFKIRRHLSPECRPTPLTRLVIERKYDVPNLILGAVA
jgi:hypothetical protein